MLLWLQNGGAAQAAAAQAATEAVAEEGTAPPVGDAAETYGSLAQAIRGMAQQVLPADVTEALQDFGSLRIWGVSLLELAGALLVILITLVVRALVLRGIDRHVKRYVERTQTVYDDLIVKALRRAASIFIILGGLVVAFALVELPSEPVDVAAGVWRVLNTLIIVFAGVLAYRIIDILLHFVAKRQAARGDSTLDKQFMPLLKDAIKVAIFVIALIAVLQGWGYSASGILAGVGIGGLALAFAAQESIANIFGSFVIYTDRPYRVGDWIIIGGVEGTVEEIGIRSTRIRKFDKTLVSVPNKLVASESIQNFSEMPVRRVKVYVGLSYDASTAQVRAVVDDIRELLRTNEEIDQTFWMVNFTELSESSLDVLVYCFTKTTVWKRYMDIRQDLLLRIVDICNDHGVEIAFPSRTLYHRGIPAAAGLPEELRRVAAGLPAELRRAAPSGLPADLRPAKGGGEGFSPDVSRDERAEFDTAEGEGEGDG